MTSKEVHQVLMQGNPRIICGPHDWDTMGVILLCVRELSDNEEKMVVGRLKEIFSK